MSQNYANTEDSSELGFSSPTMKTVCCLRCCLGNLHTLLVAWTYFILSFRIQVLVFRFLSCHRTIRNGSCFTLEEDICCQSAQAVGSQFAFALNHILTLPCFLQSNTMYYFFNGLWVCKLLCFPCQALFSFRSIGQKLRSYSLKANKSRAYSSS